MGIIWSIWKQRVWTNLTCTLNLSRKVSVLALLADSLALQFTLSHDTVFISVQNLTLAPLLVGITKCKGWKSWRKPLLLPWRPWALPRAENKHLAGLSYCEPVFLMIESLQQSFFGEHWNEPKEQPDGMGEGSGSLSREYPSGPQTPTGGTCEG